MTKRLYIANRGEIALRIVRAAKSLGIETVLGVSLADRGSLAAQEADRTLTLGPAQPRDSYLNIAANIHAAKASGCSALHPGYGFLSERAPFATGCEENRIAFIGPRAASIKQVGDKLSARALAQSTGVPLTSGSEKIDNIDHAVRIANEIGFPVITKASAGGGGRGMVVATTEAELRTAFDQASRTALEAFGDGTLFLERYVETARHIEVQAFGDGKGKVIHFGERDCSIQRRYQKMIEEAPAAILPDQLRSKIRQAAIDLLSSIKYRNAGTVEFLYDVERQEFYFMEVNARIQVEHPVSEEISGVDLIKRQIELAFDPDAPIEQVDAFNGHAIEARILAEDPSRDFLPSPGRIKKWSPPQSAGVRLDSAMFEGAMVPPYYDSMIGKLIVHGATRQKAVEKLRQALEGFTIEGVATNIPFLKEVAGHPDFIANRVDTRWLERTIIPSYSAKK